MSLAKIGNEGSITSLPSQDEISQEKLDEYVVKIGGEQNLGLATAGGIVVGIIGAIAWAFLTIATGYQIGYMALFIGLGVGYTMRSLGKGRDKIFGIISASIAFISCVFGDLLSIFFFAAQEMGISFFEAIRSVDWLLFLELFITTLGPIDLVFFALAIITGYQSAFRVISNNEVIHNIKN